MPKIVEILAINNKESIFRRNSRNTSPYIYAENHDQECFEVMKKIKNSSNEDFLIKEKKVSFTKSEQLTASSTKRNTRMIGDWRKILEQNEINPEMFEFKEVMNIMKFYSAHLQGENLLLGNLIVKEEKKIMKTKKSEQKKEISGLITKGFKINPTSLRKNRNVSSSDLSSSDENLVGSLNKGKSNRKKVSEPIPKSEGNVKIELNKFPSLEVLEKDKEQGNLDIQKDGNEKQEDSIENQIKGPKIIKLSEAQEILHRQEGNDKKEKKNENRLLYDTPITSSLIPRSQIEEEYEEEIIEEIIEEVIEYIEEEEEEIVGLSPSPVLKKYTTEKNIPRRKPSILKSHTLKEESFTNNNSSKVLGEPCIKCKSLLSKVGAKFCGKCGTKQEIQNIKKDTIIMIEKEGMFPYKMQKKVIYFLFIFYFIVYYYFFFQIGEGGYGSVFIATNEKKKKFAVKKMKIDENNTIELIKKEISVMEFLKNENVVLFNAAYQHENTFYVVMELMDFGSLTEILDLFPSVILNESQIAYICKSILFALNYLHKSRMIHRFLHF